ncbi:polymorphic toxin-type HINT domain-containing protein [Streptomyces glaucescens]|uniref:polymorphic toxin-type HINT domain-containing protein n=1 Tax=Streptomyces glaucescens TaxID=1907 RepID=UPI00344DABBA
MPVTAAALLVGLLPTQALALPPDPAKEEVGRESLVLEALKRERVVPGAETSAPTRHLETLRALVPEDLAAPPPGTVSPPSDLDGAVTFGPSATPASARTAGGTVQQAALSPVGTLPVSLGQAPDQPAPTGTWRVRIEDRTEAAGRAIDGTLLTVQAPDTGAVPVSVRLDYSTFENLYGADWASRLLFVQFPECYLTRPDDEACQSYQELDTDNDTASKTITATVDPAADGTVTPASADSAPAPAPGVVQAAYRTSTSVTPAAAGDSAVLGAIDSGGGDRGSFKASPLPSSGKWEVAGSSGAFVWEYPLVVPDPPAGPKPNVSLTYNSQTVDGRTAVSSPQNSWIGEGWNYDVGFVERRYRTCEDDRKPLDSGTPNNTASKDKTSDLCWVSYNAVLSLNGQTNELVRIAASGSDPETDTEYYRLQKDDGTRVEHRVGGTNGDNNGEYWVVTTRDGTKYMYGQNQVGGGHADTDSVSTVPVFGNHPGEPCHATAFADSRCGAGKRQAWRWGLDRVVDVHGNTMIVNWKQETNHYAVRKKYNTPEQYDRYAYPLSIEYGMRPDTLTKPSATVRFGVKQRCLESGTLCDGTNFDKTDDPGAYRYWWDTPGNLNCKSTSKMCPGFPSFWTQMRLDTVTTEAARAGETAPGRVDKYTLHQSFPKDWYDTAPGLWLNAITRTGYAPGDATGTLQSKDGVSFAEYRVGSDSPLKDRLRDRQLPNRVPAGKNDPTPGFTRPRIGTVSTESGGDIEVEYTGGCASTPAEDKGKSNSTCYPLRWSIDPEVETPPKVWFNKYVVASVREIDKITPRGEPIVTRYSYSGPAWAKNDDEFTRPALRTYSDWRGYRQVTAYKGGKSTSGQGDHNSQSRKVTRYFLGTGGAVEDSSGTYTLLADDAPQYAGMAAETITYRDSVGDRHSRTLTFPSSRQTASRPRENEDGTAGDPLLAHRVWIKRTDEIQDVDSSWRAVRTNTTVDDTYGLPTSVETAVVRPNGTGEALSERTCTTTSYVHNVSAWLIGLTAEQHTTATSCAAQPAADPATTLKSKVHYTYDGLAHGSTPAKGLLTSVAENNGTGTAQSHVSTTTYDPLGRVRKVTTPGSGTTETQYTPGDDGGPVTQVRSINALGHVTTTTFDPGRGLPLTVTDANGRITRNEYDALGRLVKGWTPSRSSVGQSPTVQISYQAAVATPKTNRPASVTVQTLKDDGAYARQVTLYDGLQREVQTQAEAHGPGRIVVDTKYDDHGLVSEKTSGYLAQGDPSTDLFSPRSESLIPSLVRYRYDGLGRQYRASVYHSGEYQYGTHTSYHDTGTYVDPAGSTAPRVWTEHDALGRVTSVTHYSKDSGPEGRTTSYEYDARGNRSKVTDPADNVWSYVHDARGRVTSSTDPDTGTTHTWYDVADRPYRVRDARGQETFTEYDTLGRARYVREGSATGDWVKQFTYDQARGGVGMPSASTRRTADGDYSSSVTQYDAEYNVLTSEIAIPANSMTTGLSGTYAYSYTYTPTGKPQSVVLPAKGGLAKEKVVTRYNGDGLPESTSGLTWYTSDVTYSPFGEALRSVSAAQPYRVWTTNFVDPHTGRLQRTIADRETGDSTNSVNSHRITDGYYSYDVSGTITSSMRKLYDASVTTWDTQCFTYDVMGELVHAWTSKITPGFAGTGCKAADGTTWGHRSDYAPSSGPVTDAPDAATDVDAPDSTLKATLAAAAPDPATVSTGPTAYRQSYTFDWIGNRATMTEHDPADATKNVTYTYGYGKEITGNGTIEPYTIQPHTMTWVSSTPEGKGGSYSYDATGNTEVRDLHDTTQTLNWTAEQKLASITDDGTKTTYVYDAAGNRILEHSPAGSTLYLGETELTTNSTGTITRASRAYGQAGAPTVVRTTTNAAATGHKLSVLLADHLGTANTSVDIASGQAVTRRAFKPYGEIRGTKPTNWPNKRSYLGTGIDDEATGLTHIGAREYDQNTGRFLSADPLLVVTAPLQMNGYAYSNNSPVSTSDPTGLCPQIDCPTRPTPNHENSTPTQSAPPGPPRYSQNHQAAQAAGNVYPPSFIKKSHEIYPGIFVDRSWKNANQFAHQFHKEIENWCRGFGGDCLSDIQDRQAEQQVVRHLKLLACMHLGRDSGCGRHVPNFGAALANAGVLSGGIGEGPGGLSLGGGTGARGRGGNCTQCFLAGTDVLMAGGKTKDIEDVTVGDKVLATDPETGRTGLRTVTHLIVTEHDKHFNELSIATDDGIEKLTATHEHPFWSPSALLWVEARDLKPGMTLLTDKGDTVIVTGNRAFTRHARTYNLTVDDLHTYYVLAGKTPVLVHNAGECPVTGLPHGALGESATLQRLQNEGYTNITREVRFKNSQGDVFRADFVAQNPSGNWVAVEVKTGRGASLTDNQALGYAELGHGGAVLNTSRVPGLKKGSTVTMKVEVDLWRCPDC